MSRARGYGWHVVLGAGCGLGAAYARYVAADGQRLLLIGRGAEALDRTAAECRVLGAGDVCCATIDVLQINTVEDVIAEYSAAGLLSVWIGGPGATPGSLWTIAPDAAWHSVDAVWRYPLRVLHTLAALEGHPSLPVHLVSSAAAESVDPDGPFFLSSLLRNAFDRYVTELVALPRYHAVNLHIHRPHVVQTRLSLQFAATLVGLEFVGDIERDIDTSARACLCSALRDKLQVMDIPTADDWVRTNLQHHHHPAAGTARSCPL